MKTQKSKLPGQCKTNTIDVRPNKRNAFVNACIYLPLGVNVCRSTIFHTHISIVSSTFVKRKEKTNVKKQKKMELSPSTRTENVHVCHCYFNFLSVKVPETILNRVLRGNSNYISSMNFSLLFRRQPSSRLFTY